MGQVPERLPDARQVALALVEVNGQGSGGSWFVIGTNGKLIKG